MRLSIEQKTSLQATYTCKQEDLLLLHAKVLRAVRQVDGAYTDAIMSASFNYEERTWPLGDIDPLLEYEDAFVWKPNHDYRLTINTSPIDQRDAEWLYEQFQEISRDFD